MLIYDPNYVDPHFNLGNALKDQNQLLEALKGYQRVAIRKPDLVVIGNGDFYTYRLLHALGVKDLNDGVVRCSMAHYNTAEEVDCLIYAIDHIL